VTRRHPTDQLRVSGNPRGAREDIDDLARRHDDEAVGYVRGDDVAVAGPDLDGLPGDSQANAGRASTGVAGGPEPTARRPSSGEAHDRDAVETREAGMRPDVHVADAERHGCADAVVHGHAQLTHELRDEDRPAGVLVEARGDRPEER
jgi:hypothetical protein